ncbi:MAG: helix-turn-helix transcriptional regulator [Umezawaea sp.]
MSDGHGLNPVVQQRRLRSELRRARDQAHLTQKEVADALEWSTSKIIRIETGAVGVTVTDLRALLSQYKINDKDQVDRLLAMSRASKQRAWWDKYKDSLGAEFVKFLAMESSASIVRQFQFLFIPGLLQTRGYAQATFQPYETDSEVTRRRVEIRIERQRVLDNPDGAQFFFVLDEATVRRQIGGPEVMREQLLHLKELNKSPNINVQILPFSAGVRPAMQSSFAILEFPPDDHDYIDYVVQLEQVVRDVLIENDPELASQYVEHFMVLESIAHPGDQLDSVIDSLLAELADR